MMEVVVLQQLENRSLETMANGCRAGSNVSNSSDGSLQVGKWDVRKFVESEWVI